MTALDENLPMLRRMISLQQRSAGDWHCDLELADGWHEYLFLVDGAWVMDPEAQSVCPDGAGGFNAVRRVQAASALPEKVAALPEIASMTPRKPRRLVRMAV